MSKFVVQGFIYSLIVGLSALVGCSGGHDERPTAPAPPFDDAARAQVDANTAFAVDSYARLAETAEGNLIYSPYSLSSAMAMVFAGARGETAAEMADALHFELRGDQLHRAFAAINDKLALHDDGRKYELVIANRLWGRKGTQFHDTYVQSVRDHYGALLKTADFAGDPAGACDAVNDWVSQRTNDRINSIMSPADVSKDTVLVLVNAVYFLGRWEYTFSDRATRDESFFLDAERSVETPMMNQEEPLEYLGREDVQLLALPYEDCPLEMIILLPREREGLAAFEASLNGGELTRWIDEMGYRQIEVTLPRFEFRSQMVLRDQLEAMGCARAFTPRKPDLSGIGGDPGEIWLEKVIQEAYIRVDEEGTEAIAATVDMASDAAAMPYEEIVEFRADHPFLFLIRDRETGSLLFIGRVVDPTQ